MNPLQFTSLKLWIQEKFRKFKFCFVCDSKNYSSSLECLNFNTDPYRQPQSHQIVIETYISQVVKMFMKLAVRFRIASVIKGFYSLKPNHFYRPISIATKFYSAPKSQTQQKKSERNDRKLNFIVATQTEIMTKLKGNDDNWFQFKISRLIKAPRSGRKNFYGSCVKTNFFYCPLFFHFSRRWKVVKVN